VNSVDELLEQLRDQMLTDAANTPPRDPNDDEDEQEEEEEEEEDEDNDDDKEPPVVREPDED
jgi:ribosomal protein L12E/L44/L45/RPP1/RPP2